MTRVWHNQLTIQSKRYTCGFCGSVVGPDRGTFSEENVNGHLVITFIYFCSHCGQPTYFDDDGEQFPGVMFGGDVNHLPQPIEQLYDEARGALSSQAHTPAVLACRKILMNVAVSLGANAGNSFVSYVQYLADQG